MSGGGIFCWSAILNLYNSTLAQNTATNNEWSGGGLASHYVTEPNIINSLFWGNTPNSIKNGYQQTPVLVSYSLTQEAWGGQGNLAGTDPLFMNPYNEDFSLQPNSPCIDAGTADLDQDGTDDITDYLGSAPDMGAIEYQSILHLDRDLLPKQYLLHQNYPNPFNPVTSLRYDLPEDGLVNITIYDMMGRIVKTLINTKQSSGYKSVQWNATDNLGQPVSAGVYLYSIETKDFRQTKKMILLK